MSKSVYLHFTRFCLILMACPCNASRRLVQKHTFLHTAFVLSQFSQHASNQQFSHFSQKLHRSPPSPSITNRFVSKCRDNLKLGERAARVARQSGVRSASLSQRVLCPSPKIRKFPLFPIFPTLPLHPICASRTSRAARASRTDN